MIKHGMGWLNEPGGLQQKFSDESSSTLFAIFAKIQSQDGSQVPYSLVRVILCGRGLKTWQSGKVPSYPHLMVAGGRFQSGFQSSKWAART